jgi:hypothetical protein
MIPDHSQIVAAVAGTRDWQMHTHEGLRAFTEAAVVALHERDPNWGHLKKKPGQTQIDGRAEDSALYRAPQENGKLQSVDFVADANTPSARPAWQPDTPRYSDADWLAPQGVVPPPPVEPPAPPVPPVPPPVDTELHNRIALVQTGMSFLINQIAAQRNDIETLHRQLANTYDQIANARLEIKEARAAMDRPLTVEIPHRLLGTLRGTVKP